MSWSLRVQLILAFEQDLSVIHPQALVEVSLVASCVRYILALAASATSTGSGCAVSQYLILALGNAEHWAILFAWIDLCTANCFNYARVFWILVRISLSTFR